MNNPIITATQAQNVVIENFGTFDIVMPLGEQSIQIPHGLGVKPSYINVLYADPNNVELNEADISVDAYEITIVNNTSNINGTIKIWWCAKLKL